MYHYVARGNRGSLDAKAFLPYCYRLGSLAGAAFPIPVKSKCQLENRGRNFCSICTCVKGDQTEALATRSIRMP